MKPGDLVQIDPDMYEAYSFRSELKFIGEMGMIISRYQVPGRQWYSVQVLFGERGIFKYAEHDLQVIQ